MAFSVAGSDQRAARICLAADPPLPGVAAYHCQQAIEKLLKGFLVRSNTDFGKTHDLDELGQSSSGGSSTRGTIRHTGARVDGLERRLSISR